MTQSTLFVSLQPEGVGQVLRLTRAWIPKAGEDDLRGWEWYYLRSLCHAEQLTLPGRDLFLKSVRWSPDGDHAAYESGAGEGRTTHLLAVDPNGLSEVASIPGGGLVFAPSGREVAYLVVPETEAFLAARDELQGAVDPADRAARYRLRAEMARLDAEYTQIVVRELASGRERRVNPEGIGVLGLLYNPGDGALYFVGAKGGEAASTDVYRLAAGGEARRITSGGAQLSDPFFARGG